MIAMIDARHIAWRGHSVTLKLGQEGAVLVRRHVPAIVLAFWPVLAGASVPLPALVVK